MTTEALGTANPETPEPEAKWIPTDSPFGARLAMIRQRMGWGNVKEAALACGLPPESWRTWERDNVNPQKYVAICRQIAEHTGCDLDWLMRGSGGVEPTEHKIRFARSASRPVDNRPSGGPRKGGDRDLNRRPQDDARRPQRIRALPAGTTTRRAA